MATDSASPATPAPGGGDAGGAPVTSPGLIETLTIEHLRGIRQVRLTGLGRVNLLTGRNNIGKSTVLEALRLLASPFVPATLNELLRDRGEMLIRPDAHETTAWQEGALVLSTLFSGFPRPGTDWPCIRVTAQIGDFPLELGIGIGRLAFDQPGWRVLKPQPDTAEGAGHNGEQVSGTDDVPGLVVDVGASRTAIPIIDFRRDLWRHDPFRIGAPARTGLTAMYVGPAGGLRTDELADLWDRIALSDLEAQVEAMLRIVEPRIEKVSMVGDAGQQAKRKVIARARGWMQPVPMRTFGDGLNRLFGIALSLVNAKGGLLLIDEFENGLHYSVQADAWRMIFRLAADLGVQVFATTHSWDAVEAFQQAATESPEQGALVRLALRGEELVATTFSEDDLAVVTRRRLEVR